MHRLSRLGGLRKSGVQSFQVNGKTYTCDAHSVVTPTGGEGIRVYCHLIRNVPEEIMSGTTTPKYERQVVTLNTKEGPQQVTAYVSPEFPGLAVHHPLGYKQYWTISHIPSGRVVTPLPTALKRDHALRFAATLAKLGNWNVPADELPKSLINQARDVIIKLRQFVE